MQIENLCIYCMREKNDPYEVCPHCGHRNEEYVVGQNHLPPLTILNGKFLLGRALGEGGFGIVYIAMDLSLEVPVAIKELFPSDYVTRDTSGQTRQSNVTRISESNMVEASRRKFIQEARTLARMQNTIKGGIVNVKELFEENGTAYMVMEFLDGTDLKNYIRHQGRIEPNTLFEMMRPVILSLKQIHDAGIIHRDISPDNIMLLRNGEVKLLDFGGVRDAYSDEKSQMILMKKGYTPMEQYQAHGNIGPWTDVYALCATMYRCLTGQLPPEPMAILQDGIKPPSAFGVAISPRQEEALLKGLEVQIPARLQNMQELYDGLYGNVSQEIIPEQIPGPVTTPGNGSEHLYDSGKRSESKSKDGLVIGVFVAIFIAAVAVIGILLCRDLKPDFFSHGGTRHETATDNETETEEESATDTDSGIHIIGAKETELTPSVLQIETEKPTELELVTEKHTEPPAESEFLEYPQMQTAAVKQKLKPVSLFYASEVHSSGLPVITPERINASADGGSSQANLCMDGDETSAWRTKDTNAYLQASFDGQKNVRLVRFHIGDWSSEEAYWKNCRPRTIYVDISGETYTVIFPDVKQDFMLVFEYPVPADEMTFSIADAYAGTQTNDICISEITIYEGTVQKTVR